MVEGLLIDDIRKIRYSVRNTLLEVLFFILEEEKRRKTQ